MPTRSNLLFAAGGDVFAKYGTLTRRYQIAQLGGEGMKESVSRASVGMVHLNTPAGLVAQSVLANVGRVTYRTDPVNGVIQPYWLFEPSTLNSMINSNLLNSAGWGGNNTTATNNATTAPDGTTTASFIQDNATNSTHYRAQTITNTAGEALAFSAYIKAGTHTKVLWTCVDSGTTTGYQFQVNLATGTISAGTKLGTGVLLVPPTITAMANGWYYVTATVQLDNPGSATTASCFFYNCDNSFNGTYAGDGTNILAVWHCQIERNGVTSGKPATTIVPTAGSTASRASEAASVPWFIGQGPMWVYARFIENGSSSTNNGAGPCQFGGGLPFSRFDDFQPGYRWSHQEVAGAFASGTTTVPTIGQVCELLGLTFPDGSVQLVQSINQGADLFAARSGALAFTPNYSTQALNIDVISWFAHISRLMVGTFDAAGAPTTVAAARLIPV